VTPTPTYQPPEQRSNLMPALVAGAIIALFAFNFYLYVQIDHVRTDVAQVQEKLSTELTNLRDSANVMSEAQKRHLDTLREELDAARSQARQAASQGKTEAQAYADQKVHKLEAEQARVQQQVSSEISDVKTSVQATDAKVAGVSSDVGTVKTQVTATQSELDKTIADLKSVRGDMGVQSGLIATNSTELNALKLRGERNYVDIKLDKTKKPQRFGDISLQLKKIDIKKGQYSLTVIADDKTSEKDNKTINEPVQFYVARGGHTPYELVINKVAKNEIVGYLATPKDQATR
jgi:hypothetical protein